MNHRIKITLSDSTIDELRGAAQARGEPMARLAARLISAGLAPGESKPEPPPPRQPGEADTAGPQPRPARRACWIEPFDGEQEWRRDMWAAIVALRERYPRELGHLKDAWWEQGTHVETLCALAVWRDWIDRAADDPREELVFHSQLEEYGRALRQEGGGVSAVWQPDAPPNEWA